jgi:hypothetical protein
MIAEEQPHDRQRQKERENSVQKNFYTYAYGIKERLKQSHIEEGDINLDIALGDRRLQQD